MTAGPRVDVVIDRLVVHGTTRSRARVVARDLEARLGELAHGWLDGTVPAPSAGHPRLQSGPVTVAARQPGTTLGSRVADAVIATVAGRGSAKTGPTNPAPDRGATP